MLDSNFYQKVKNGIKTHLRIVKNAFKNDILNVINGGFSGKMLHERITVVSGGKKKGIESYLKKALNN